MSKNQDTNKEGIIKEIKFVIEITEKNDKTKYVFIDDNGNILFNKLQKLYKGIYGKNKGGSSNDKNVLRL